MQRLWEQPCGVQVGGQQTKWFQRGWHEPWKGHSGNDARLLHWAAARRLHYPVQKGTMLFWYAVLVLQQHKVQVSRAA